MRVPLNWLKEFVELEDISAEEIAEKLLLGGVEVEGISKVGEFTENYKVVEVIEVKKVQGIRLPVCVIYDGSEKHEVLSGAPNVKTGKFLWCPPGAKVKKGDEIVEIGVKKVRNVASYGMLLSPYEVGFPEGEEDRLLELPPDAPLGKPASEIFNLPDHVLDISITPQRGDLLSVFGIAIEISALLRRKLKVKEKELLNPLASHFFDFSETVNLFLREMERRGIGYAQSFSIHVDERERCFAYCGILFGGELKSGISSPYIISRLYLCGARPINPVVDITNYVLFELGQPTHAFDFSKLKGEPSLEIHVRVAKDGEKILCLDGKERELSSDDLVIADGERPIAIAGVIGGEETGVDEETKKVLLESAFFLPQTVRRTAKRHSVETESSYRFSRRVNPAGVLIGALRILDLFNEIGLKPAEFSLHTEKDRFLSPKIDVSYQFISDYLGKDIHPDIVDEILSRLFFRSERKKTNGDKEGKIVCVPPLWRGDINIKEDIVEEVARVYGYDRIPSSLPSVPTIFYEEDEDIRRRLKEEEIKNFLASLGFHEVKTYPFSSKGEIRIVNPIISEFDHLSTSLIGKIIEVVDENIRRGWRDVRVFEIAKVFSAEGEKDVLVLALSGRSFPPIWNMPKGGADIFDIKGVLELLLPDSIGFRPSPPSSLKRVGGGLTYAFDILVDGHPVGIVGASISKKRGQDIFIAEVLLEHVRFGWKGEVGKYFSELPFVERDISFFVPENLTWQEIKPAFFVENVIDAYIFDVYELKERKEEQEFSKSISVRFLLKQEKPMTSDEINQVMEKIMSRLRDLGVHIRAIK